MTLEDDMSRSTLKTLVFACMFTFFAACSDDAEKTSDTSADASASTDAGASCGDQSSCLDDKGKSDLSLCPNAADYQCLAGCCVKIEKCSADADCASKLGSDVCPDKRFLCTCGGDGECQQSACSSDKDCAAGQSCNNGGCHEAPAASELAAHLLRPYWIARPGDSVEPVVGLAAQARAADGAIAVDAKFKWALKGDSFKLEGGKLVATEKAGMATVTATVEGGSKPSTAAQLWNIGALGQAKLRVVVADDTTFKALTGKVIAIGMADKATPAEAAVAELTNGVATFDAIDFPVDVHVLAKDHEASSILRVAGSSGVADIVVSVSRYHHANLLYDAAGKQLKESELVGGDVLTGKVAYKGDGEAGLGITSLGVGGDLLSFNIDALVGPSVKRPFDDKAPTLVNPEPGKPQDIPGGVTFLLQQPVVNGYVLAGAPGSRILWSLAGRVPLSDLGPAISSIVGAVDGGLDVGKVVAALLPYLSSFYSQVVMDVPFGEKPSSPPATKDLAPDIPLVLSTTIEPAGLPKVKDGQWADLLLSVAGAMMPDGQFVPLGLTAGPDALEGAKPDGKVDGDPAEDGDQPMSLKFAPLHSGLRAGKTANFSLVHAAINVGGDGKREGGSIVISAPGPIAKKVSTGEFLGYSAGSSFDKAKRQVTVEAVTGSHLYRVILTGEKSRRWVVVVPAEATGKPLQLVDLSKFGGGKDIANKPKRVFVGAFELRNKQTTADVLTNGVLTDLVRSVKRTSFIDVK